MTTPLKSPESPAVSSVGIESSDLFGWSVGDVARVSKLENPRMLIVEISDCAYCINEHGHRCSWDAHHLMTLDQWVAEARTLGRENNINVEHYITAGTPNISWPNN